MSITLDIRGTAAVVTAMEAGAVKLATQQCARVQTVGRRVFERSQADVPRDTDELHDSGYAQPDETRRLPMGCGVEVGYTAPHAPFVHEDRDDHHERGKDKFLEGALFDTAAEMPGILSHG